MRGRRHFLGALGGTIASSLLPAEWIPRALARPVPTGRFVRIPHGVPADHPWRTGGGDPRRTHRAITTLPARAPTKRWEARVGVGRCFAPTVSRDGLAYVASQAGVGCVDASGAVLWLLRLGLASGTAAFTPEGEVAVGLAPAQVGIVGPGGLRVVASLGGGVRGSPLVLDDGSVLVAAHDQAVHRVDVDGRVIFRAPVTTQIRGTVTLTSGGLVAVPAGASVVFVDLEGHTRAVVELPSDVAFDLVATEGGEVWSLGVDGTLSRVGTSGVRASMATVVPSLASNLALAPDGSLRFGSREEGLVAVAPNGEVRWRSGRERAVTGAVTVDPDGASVALDARGALVAFEADGAVRWEAATETRGDAAPVLAADGTIYVATFGGMLSAWRV